MTVRTLSVALLTANAAFADIVCGALEERPDYRVPSFGTVDALTTFMRIAPVDVVVFDTDMPGAPALDIVAGLRAESKLANPLFKSIVLTRAAKPFHQPLLAAGIDAVMQKPVPMRQLIEAIDGLYARQRMLAAAGGQPRFMPRRPIRDREAKHTPLQRIGNVIPLFGEGRSAR